MRRHSECSEDVLECKHGNVDVFVTGPVSSGKITVAKVLAKLVMGKE